jgi:AcrR family transcriptional regulator
LVGVRRLGPEERREQILSAAICHFAEVGLTGTTRDVAARAGVTQALLYRYFASKAELLEAVFQRVFLGRLDPRWQEAIRDRGVPLRERLCASTRPTPPRSSRRSGCASSSGLASRGRR